MKGFTDVFGFDPDLLMMIPQPCKAFILLYKITETAEKLRSEEEEGLKDDKRSEKPFWMKQTIGNACGTIAIIHALANLKVRNKIPKYLRIFVLNDIYNFKSMVNFRMKLVSSLMENYQNF